MCVLVTSENEAAVGHISLSWSPCSGNFSHDLNLLNLTKAQAMHQPADVLVQNRLNSEIEANKP